METLLVFFALNIPTAFVLWSLNCFFPNREHYQYTEEEAVATGGLTLVGILFILATILGV